MTIPGKKDDIVSVIARVLVDDRERRIILFHFGIVDGVPKTLNEASREFGVTRERIRQIEERALLKLIRSKEVWDLRSYI